MAAATTTAASVSGGASGGSTVQPAPAAARCPLRLFVATDSPRRVIQVVEVPPTAHSHTYTYSQTGQVPLQACEWSRLAATSTAVYAQRRDGSVYTVAAAATEALADTDGETGLRLTRLPFTRPVKELACGPSHVLVLMVDGAGAGSSGAGGLLGWGSNAWGQLGASDVPVVKTPRVIPTGSHDPLHVFAGPRHSAIISTRHKALVWGGEQVLKTAITKTVLPGSSWASLAFGDNHGIGLSSSGDVFVWGKHSGMDRTEPVPTQVTELCMHQVVQVAAAANASFALTKEGFLFAWGVLLKSLFESGVDGVMQVPEPALVPTTDATSYFEHPVRIRQLEKWQSIWVQPDALKDAASAALFTPVIGISQHLKAMPLASIKNVPFHSGLSLHQELRQFWITQVAQTNSHVMAFLGVADDPTNVGSLSQLCAAVTKDALPPLDPSEPVPLYLPPDVTSDMLVHASRLKLEKQVNSAADASRQHTWHQVVTGTAQDCDLTVVGALASYRVHRALICSRSVPALQALMASEDPTVLKAATLLPVGASEPPMSEESHQDPLLHVLQFIYTDQVTNEVHHDAVLARGVRELASAWSLPQLIRAMNGAASGHQDRVSSYQWHLFSVVLMQAISVAKASGMATGAPDAEQDPARTLSANLQPAMPEEDGVEVSAGTTAAEDEKQDSAPTTPTTAPITEAASRRRRRQWKAGTVDDDGPLVWEVSPVFRRLRRHVLGTDDNVITWLPEMPKLGAAHRGSGCRAKRRAKHEAALQAIAQVREARELQRKQMGKATDLMAGDLALSCSEAGMVWIVHRWMIHTHAPSILNHVEAVLFEDRLPWVVLPIDEMSCIELLRFIYIGVAQLHLTNVLPLLSAAVSLHLPDLQDMVVQFIVEQPPRLSTGENMVILGRLYNHARLETFGHSVRELDVHLHGLERSAIQEPAEFVDAETAPLAEEAWELHTVKEPPVVEPSPVPEGKHDEGEVDDADGVPPEHATFYAAPVRDIFESQLAQLVLKNKAVLQHISVLPASLSTLSTQGISVLSGARSAAGAAPAPPAPAAAAPAPAAAAAAPWARRSRWADEEQAAAQQAAVAGAVESIDEEAGEGTDDDNTSADEYLSDQGPEAPEADEQ